MNEGVNLATGSPSKIKLPFKNIFGLFQQYHSFCSFNGAEKHNKSVLPYKIVHLEYVISDHVPSIKVSELAAHAGHTLTKVDAQLTEPRLRTHSNRVPW